MSLLVLVLVCTQGLEIVSSTSNLVQNLQLSVYRAVFYSLLKIILENKNSMPAQFSPKVDPAGNTIQGIKFNSPYQVKFSSSVTYMPQPQAHGGSVLSNLICTCKTTLTSPFGLLRRWACLTCRTFMALNLHWVAYSLLPFTASTPEIWCDWAPVLASPL
jgi:hypothetical protein